MNNTNTTLKNNNLKKLINNTNYLSIQPRQSCVASFKTIYGIGKIKANKLNNFLLNHPVQTRFTTHFNNILYPTSGRDVLNKIPLGNNIRLCVERFLRKKSLIYCYQMFRLFQNFLQGVKEQGPMETAFSIITLIEV